MKPHHIRGSPFLFTHSRSLSCSVILPFSLNSFGCSLNVIHSVNTNICIYAVGGFFFVIADNIINMPLLLSPASHHPFPSASNIRTSVLHISTHTSINPHIFISYPQALTSHLIYSFPKKERALTAPEMWSHTHSYTGGQSTMSLALSTVDWLGVFVFGVIHVSQAVVV